MNHPELDDLLSRWSLDILTPDEAAQLDAILREDADARREFRRHAVLNEALGGAPAEMLAAWNEPVPTRSRAGWWMAAAAAIVALLGTAIWFRPHRALVAEASVQPACAILAQSLDAAWETPALTTGSEIPVGGVHLKSGIARLEFFSGASVTIEGDALLELHSPWEARLASGKVRVHVPPAAKGFTLLTQQGKVVDLGTEYGLDVAANGSAAELHVFDGEVQLHRAGAPMESLRQGQGVFANATTVTQLASISPERFPDSQNLDGLRREHDEKRLAHWWKVTMEVRKDPRLIAYFPFKRTEGEWARNLFNRTEPPNKERNGGIVGARWSEGRWSGKDALEFKRPGDRVRLAIGGEYQAITIACWARIDSLDRKYNALLLTDGYEHGEPHWQIFDDGRLMFSVQTGNSETNPQHHNEIVYSRPFYTNARSGQWFHLAVTYDNRTGDVCQYVNGVLAGQQIAPDHRPAKAISFGPCEIGNWGLPTPGHQQPIRNLNGRIDEFAIWSAVLPGDEIARLYQQGKPE